MKKIILYVLCALAFSCPPATAGDLSFSTRISGAGEVYRAKDGDTLIVNVRDDTVYQALKQRATSEKERSHFNDRHRSIVVRLGGIDTPESVHPDQSRNTQAGSSASTFTKTLTEGRAVRFLCYDFGRYGRLICNLEVNQYDLGLRLIEAGHATYTAKYGVHPYLHDVYLQAMDR